MSKIQTQSLEDGISNKLRSPHAEQSALLRSFSSMQQERIKQTAKRNFTQNVYEAVYGSR